MFRFKIREKFFILISLVAFSSIFYMSLNYRQLQASTKKTLELEALSEALIASKKIGYLGDSITYSYMNHELELRDAMQMAQKYVKKYGRSASLESLKKKLNQGREEFFFDIYIINKNFVIDNTTYKNDLGLDFHVMPEALSVVEGIYKRDGTIDISTPSLDVLTAEYKNYILQRAQEGDFLIQLSLSSNMQESMKKLTKKMHKELPKFLSSSIYTLYPSSTNKYNIDYIWSTDFTIKKDALKKEFVHTQEIYKQFLEEFDPFHEIPKDKIREYLKKFVYEDHKTNYMMEGEKYILSVAVNYNTYSFFKNKRANILILKFDESEIKQKLHQQKLIFFSSSLFLLLLLGVISYLIDKRLIAPVIALHGLMKEKKLVDMKKYSSHKDEIVSMSLSYNQLLLDLRREIATNEELLEEFKVFTANSIHQVRTPVSVIKIALESIDAKNEEALNQIKSSLVSIEHLYDTLSYTIAQEQVEFTREKLSLSAILAQRVAFFDVVALAHDKVISYSARDDVEVFMNKTELEFLIDNNLSNALKYSPPFTKIEVSLNSSSDEVILSFVSSGDIIEDTKAIFERHFQADKSKKGNGLGLHIVNSICKKNSILINVTSNGEINQFSYFFDKNAT